MTNIKEWAKGNEDINKKIKDSKIVASVFKSFSGLGDYPDQIYRHAKLLELLADDETLIDDMVNEAIKNGATQVINLALEKYKTDLDLMGEVIPMALRMCEASPQFAKMINTQELIPILLDQGRGLLGMIDEDLSQDSEILVKITKNLKILENFSKDPTAVKVMELHGGLQYYNDIKKRCAKTIPTMLGINLNEVARRGEGLSENTAKKVNLLTDDERQRADGVLQTSKIVCGILKNWDDQFDICDKIKEFYYPLMVWGSDDPDSVSPQIAILEKACRNPDFKKLIPNEQGFAVINAIKMKYENSH
jgi:hypothetical protein